LGNETSKGNSIVGGFYTPTCHIQYTLSEKETILTSCICWKIMRGRWASAALGAGMARRRASYEMDQQAQAYEAQQQQAKKQIESQQRPIEALQR
jgi:hypothetical protein